MKAKIQLWKYEDEKCMVVIDNGYGNTLYMTDKIPYNEAVEWIDQFTASTFEVVER